MSKNIVRKCDKITIFILILLQDFHYNNFVASKGKAQAANSVGYCRGDRGYVWKPKEIEVRRVLMDKLNVAIADDNAKMTDMLGQMIEEDKDLELVGKAHNGEEICNIIKDKEPDVVILDIIMPKMDGLEVCRQFRLKEGYHTPVIMLTALGTTEDIVKGLDAGADDYLVKPFSFQELEARIKALLRRGKERPDRQLWCHDLVLDCDTRRARRGDTVIELTVKEYRLLEYFMTHQGVALSRLTLLKDVWDKNFDTNTNVVDVYVNYLRNKIDRDFEVKLIRTIVGMGYIMGVQ